MLCLCLYLLLIQFSMIINNFILSKQMIEWDAQPYQLMGNTGVGYQGLLPQMPPNHMMQNFPMNGDPTVPQPFQLNPLYMLISKMGLPVQNGQIPGQAAGARTAPNLPQRGQKVSSEAVRRGYARSIPTSPRAKARRLA